MYGNPGLPSAACCKQMFSDGSLLIVGKSRSQPGVSPIVCFSTGAAIETVPATIR